MIEQVESDEYIELCEKEKWGYCLGVDLENKITYHKSFYGDVGTVIGSVFNPMFDSEIVQPYRITRDNGYKTPIEIQNEFWKQQIKEGSLRMYFLDASEYDEKGNFIYIKKETWISRTLKQLNKQMLCGLKKIKKRL